MKCSKGWCRLADCSSSTWRFISPILLPPTVLLDLTFLTPSLSRYMKYLYPYECEKRGLSNPNELQAAIDSNRREGRRQAFGSSLFTYSPNGAPTMLSSPKVSMPTIGMAVGTSDTSLSSIQKVKKGKNSSLEQSQIQVQLVLMI